MSIIYSFPVYVSERLFNYVTYTAFCINYRDISGWACKKLWQLISRKMPVWRVENQPLQDLP
jgi:hypothetical protein